MTNASCDAKFIGYDNDREYRAGEFNYYIWAGNADPAGEAGILFGCPCGCGKLLLEPFQNSPDERPKWHWDGNKEKPTLTPSILNWNLEEETGKRTTEHWHGFLTAGRFVGC